jgi:hypothetical protein
MESPLSVQMVANPQRELRSSEPPAPLKKMDVFLTDVIHAMGVLGWVGGWMS